METDKKRKPIFNSFRSWGRSFSLYTLGQWLWGPAGQRARVAVTGLSADVTKQEVSDSPSAVLPASRMTLAEEFIGQVLGRAGLDVSHYRMRPLLRRVPACLRALRVKTIDQACELLDRRPEMLVRAVSALVIGVTEFCRDPEIFEALRTSVLPEVLTRSDPRIWSAGCSSGEELYTLAMLLAEARRLEDSHLLGTDCRNDAIEKACAGSYPIGALRQLAPDLRDRYLEDRDGRWRIREDLRGAMAWKRADLLTAVEEGPWDLILWQNVAIYLERPAVERLWRELVAVLRPGGIVVTGPAERPPEGLALSLVRRRIYRRVGD